MKGTLNAFRNLTNRMEEAVGGCTNLHISYPAMVYGLLQVMRANREAAGVSQNDVAICENGGVSDAISRYHDVMARLAGRNDVRSETTKHEAVALAMVDPNEPHVGEIVATFPPNGSPLLLNDFFSKLYAQYDQRIHLRGPPVGADYPSPVLGSGVASPWQGQDARIRAQNRMPRGRVVPVRR